MVFSMGCAMYRWDFSHDLSGESLPNPGDLPKGMSS